MITFHMDQVMLGVVLLGLIGLGLNQLANAVEARVLRWKRF
jgi:sulfonate transport system permease protein